MKQRNRTFAPDWSYVNSRQPLLESLDWGLIWSLDIQRKDKDLELLELVWDHVPDLSMRGLQRLFEQHWPDTFLTDALYEREFAMLEAVDSVFYNHTLSGEILSYLKQNEFTGLFWDREENEWECPQLSQTKRVHRVVLGPRRE